jgi:hypothetical protein
MRSVLASTALAAALVLAQPVAVSAQDDQDTSPEELTAEAVDRLLRALDLLLGSIPQYEAPYVNENGDIIIKRKHPEGDGGDLPTPEEKPAPPGDTDSTTT